MIKIGGCDKASLNRDKCPYLSHLRSCRRKLRLRAIVAVAAIAASICWTTREQAFAATDDSALYEHGDRDDLHAQAEPEKAAAEGATKEQSPVQIAAYCSPTSPGVAVAEIRWPLGSKSLSSTELSNQVQSQVLDVTVFKDGFERGLYSVVRPGGPDPKLLSSRTQQASDIPGLRNLKLTQFATTQQAAVQGLRLSMRPPAAQVSAIAKLEGMEPGMRYFVRLSSQGSAQKVASFSGPICPVDWVNPPKR